ncbi:MAG: hypothetical protein ACFFD2_03975 [Promethearchaeota archaeon]
MEKVTKIQYQVKWEGRYSQCSYNNLASVLDNFYGVPNKYPSDNVFPDALPQKMRGFYGWAPYTGFMVKSQQLVWNSQKVINLDCEWFDLISSREGRRDKMSFTIQFEEGELKSLKKKLLDYLAKGPIILWVPYGAGSFRFSPFAGWKNVKQESKNKYKAILPWSTHCIVIGGYINGYFRIVDCSDRSGIFLISSEQLLVNVVAMKINPAAKKLRFLEGSAFHCCIFQK